MAQKTDIGPKITLDGEAEFRQALRNIDAGLKVNASEMKLVTATYEQGGKSAKDLTAKQKALTSQIENQKTKVETLEKALQNSILKTGESSRSTMNWQAQLNRAKAGLADMNRELGENQEALAKTEKGTASLADVVTGLTNTLGINIPPAMQGMITKLDGVSASGAALVGVLGGIVMTLGKLTISTAQTADEILTLSITTGLSTDALQEFEYASELLDVSSETMQGSLTKMIKSMEAARKGTKESAEAYQELGIRVTDSKGNLRDANEVYYEAIDALGQMSNETQRDALAMQVFGRSARELNPLIEAGSAKLRELSEEAHNVGYVMSGDTLQQFGALDDAMQRMSKQTDALKNSFAVALLPILTKFFEVISSVPVPVLQMIIVLTGVVTTIVLAVKAIKEMTQTADAIKMFFRDMDQQAMKTTLIVMGVVAAVLALLAAITVLTGKGGELRATLNSVGNMTSNLTSPRNLRGYAKGTDFHPGGLALVGERGPEIVDLPRGSKVYPNGAGPAMGGDTYNISINARNIQEFNDIIRIAQRERQSQRMGYVPT